MANTLTEREIAEIGFRTDNTEGYSQGQLDALNTELAERIDGLDPFESEWYEAANAFVAEASRR